jgi:hypothetical protein
MKEIFPLSKNNALIIGTSLIVITAGITYLAAKSNGEKTSNFLWWGKSKSTSDGNPFDNAYVNDYEKQRQKMMGQKTETFSFWNKLKGFWNTEKIKDQSTTWDVQKEKDESTWNTEKDYTTTNLWNKK